MPVISNLGIQFTQGDAVTLDLYAQEDSGAETDLTGATFTTQFPLKDSVVEFADGKHSIVDAEKGHYRLTLTAADTALIEAGAQKDIFTVVTKGGNPVTYRGIGAVTVFTPASPTALSGQSNIFIGAAL